MKDVILQDVLDYILKCKDNNKLVEINELLKDKLKSNASKLKYELKPGDKVKVNGTGKFESGVVTKVNKSRAVLDVMINDIKYSYTVPFTMISKEVSNDS